MEYKNFDIKEVVCHNINKYRLEKNFSIEELADKVGISVKHLERLESSNKRNDVSLITLYRISMVLNVDIDKFFE